MSNLLVALVYQDVLPDDITCYCNWIRWKYLAVG